MAILLSLVRGEAVLEFVQEDERNRGRMNRKPINAAVAKAVQAAIDRILQDADDKMSVAKLSELVKLLQMQGDLGQESPQEINVRWIETWESKPSNDE